MLPLSRRIAVSANVVFSLYPTRNKVYLILSYLILSDPIVMIGKTVVVFWDLSV